MSKFIERLQKVGQQTPAPLGFGAARREAEIPHIMLIGQVSPDDLTKDAGLLESKVDAVLIKLGSSPDKLTDSVAESLKGKVWGVQVSEIDTDEAEELKKKGCDFVIFDADKTAAGVLNDEDLGTVLTVDSDFDEDMARAVHGLDVDAAFFEDKIDDSPLTVKSLVEIQKVRSLIGKPFIMACELELNESDLESLRNGDINALVADLSSKDEIAKTKEMIDKLPRRRPRTGQSDIVPRVTTGFRPTPEPPPDEEDDDDY